MKKAIALLTLGLLTIYTPVMAQDENSGVIPEEPTFTDNTQATNTEANPVNVVDGTGSGQGGSGAVNGEITILRTSAGVDVYSGMNKVEVIDSGSDGWVGRVQDNSSYIDFTPTNRPKLKCDAQSLSGWFGPCKLEESGAS